LPLPTVASSAVADAEPITFADEQFHPDLHESLMEAQNRVGVDHGNPNAIAEEET